MSIAIHIDLRAQLGPVRHQGNRPACLAFALSELNRFHGNGDQPLSPEYLYASAARRMPGWVPHDGLSLNAGLSAVVTPGQPLDVHCPYVGVEPSLPFVALPLHDPMHLNAFTPLPHDASSIWALVDAGIPVGIGIALTPEFFQPTNGVVTASTSALPNSDHAVVAAGLGRRESNQERHFLIRNSWGSGWGMGGHVWIPEQYLTAHVVCAFGV